jgi:hypothetical protein
MAIRKRKPKSARQPAAVQLPANLPPVDRGNRWRCTRKDCYSKPVNFGDCCRCCGQARK